MACDLTLLFLVLAFANILIIPDSNADEPICAEDPIWDDPGDTRSTCTNKFFRPALGLYGGLPKDAVVRGFSIVCRTVCVLGPW